MYEQICKTSRFYVRVNYQKYVCVKKYIRIFSPRRSTKTATQSLRRPHFSLTEKINPFICLKTFYNLKNKAYVIAGRNQMLCNENYRSHGYVSFPWHLSSGMHSGPPQNQKSPRGTGDHRTAQWNYWRRQPQQERGAPAFSDWYIIAHLSSYTF